jgi:putative nucleotidyltransferase with HDIG domain
VTFEGRFDMVGDLQRPGDSQLLAVAGGGLVAGLLGTLLRAPAERVLGNVPRERLLELQDLSHPLLRTLAREAPGTYEHSRAMANLAEQAASAIGADALLTRVGAYYHDIGKTAQPRYFVENLELGAPSPHDALDPDVSADAIMAHVVIGTRMLREAAIPEPVVEFAYTHHGTQVVEFFWNRCLEQGNPKGLDESDFRYPGGRPQTKETAILMLVDSIEAASRTVDPPDREQFELLVQSIAFAKLRSGQLDECGLRLSELRIITSRVTDTLVNMHHQRIRYPWQIEQAEEFGVPFRAMLASAPESEFGPPPTTPPPVGQPARSAVSGGAVPVAAASKTASPLFEASERIVPPVMQTETMQAAPSNAEVQSAPSSTRVQSTAVSSDEQSARRPRADTADEDQGAG